MSDDFGFDMGQVLALSKNLKGIEPDLRKELHAGLRDGGKPLVPVLRDALADEYGSKGGLSQQIRKAPARVAVKTGGREVAIQVIFKGITVKLGEVYGFFRHPVYADKTKTRKDWKWVRQPVSGGKDHLFKVTKDHLHLVTPKVQKAVQDVVDKVVSRRG